MQTIIETALSCHKPTKEAAQRYIRALYEGAETDAQRRQLAELYVYFMPTAPKTPKTPAQWVASAVETSKQRAYLCHPYSDGEGHLVATDGHRLHIAPTDLPQGYYHAKTMEPLGDAAKGWAFPGYTRIMPSALTIQETARPLNREAPAPVLEERGVLKYDFAPGSTYTWSKTYVDAALAGLTAGPVRWCVYGGWGTLYLTDGTCSAVIAGMRE